MVLSQNPSLRKGLTILEMLMIFTLTSLSSIYIFLTFQMKKDEIEKYV